MPYLSALAEFRDGVRSLAREKKDPKEILKLSDILRDDVLPELGVRLEDREGDRALVKLEDKEVLLQEKRKKEEQAAEKLKKKQEQAVRDEQKRQEKLLKGKSPPAEMFNVGEYAGKFSTYDEKGLPVLDQEGKEVSKSLKRKLEKEQEKQVQLHEEYLAAQTGASTSS